MCKEERMRKNFMVAAAMVAAGLFMTAEVAQAADVSFSGQIRQRAETAKDFTSGTAKDFTNDTRVRLNTKVKINDTTSAFVQMQSVRTNGSSGSGQYGTNSFIASDRDNSVGIHQAYFTLNDVAGTGTNMKFGRQEIVLDGHRLYGHTGWTTGAQTNDAVRFDHKHGDTDLTYIFINALDGNAGSSDISDHVIRLSQKGILGGSTQAYYVYRADNCGANMTASATATATTCNNQENSFSTVGVRQSGKLYGLSYRAEYYHQYGEASGSIAANTGIYQTEFSGGDASDRDAYMYGVRVGKSFSNVAMKPSVTLWYDYLSGNDDGDITGNSWAAFNTLNDTGHKFYGFMDKFLAYGNVNKGWGMEDIAVKVKLNPIPGWTLKVDHHWLSVTSKLGEASRKSLYSTTNDLGNETDVTLIKKLNANTKLVLGYSHFDADQLFKDINTTKDEADWAYIMFDVKF